MKERLKIVKAKLYDQARQKIFGKILLDDYNTLSGGKVTNVFLRQIL